jgi:hypothetical protein
MLPWWELRRGRKEEAEWSNFKSGIEPLESWDESSSFEHEVAEKILTKSAVMSDAVLRALLRRNERRIATTSFHFSN